jgi:hypothetical protein
MNEEIFELVAVPPLPAVEETHEQREARLNLEDYQRRNMQAMDEYEKIVGRPHPARSDPEAAVRQRCGNCGF